MKIYCAYGENGVTFITNTLADVKVYRINISLYLNLQRCQFLGPSLSFNSLEDPFGASQILKGSSFIDSPLGSGPDIPQERADHSNDPSARSETLLHAVPSIRYGLEVVRMIKFTSKFHDFR